MASTSLSSGRIIALLAVAACAAPQGGSGAARLPAAPDMVKSRRVFDENSDPIPTRERARYLATYLQTDGLARKGPAGLELGFEGWSARRDSTWPDTLIARNLRVHPIAPGVVYGTYCYNVTQKDTTSSGVSERVIVKTPAGRRLAGTTAFRPA